MVIMGDLHSNPVYISSFSFSETFINIESRVLNKFVNVVVVVVAGGMCSVVCIFVKLS